MNKQDQELLYRTPPELKAHQSAVIKKLSETYQEKEIDNIAGFYNEMKNWLSGTDVQGIMVDIGNGGVALGNILDKEQYEKLKLFIAIENDLAMVLRNKRRGNQGGKQVTIIADALNLPFIDGSITIIRSSAMLHHIGMHIPLATSADRLQRVFREIARSLRPGGRAVIADNELPKLAHLAQTLYVNIKKWITGSGAAPIYFCRDRQIPEGMIQAGLTVLKNESVSVADRLGTFTLITLSDKYKFLNMPAFLMPLRVRTCLARK